MAGSLLVMEDSKTCANCRRRLDIGNDAVRTDEGVMGVRKFVALDKTLFFCCDSCISDYFRTDDLPSVKKRIP